MRTVETKSLHKGVVGARHSFLPLPPNSDKLDVLLQVPGGEGVGCRGGGGAGQGLGRQLASREQWTGPASGGGCKHVPPPCPDIVRSLRQRSRCHRQPRSCPTLPLPHPDPVPQVVEGEQRRGKRLMVFCNTIDSCRAAEHHMREQGLATGGRVGGLVSGRAGVGKGGLPGQAGRQRADGRGWERTACQGPAALPACSLGMQQQPGHDQKWEAHASASHLCLQVSQALPRPAPCPTPLHSLIALAMLTCNSAPLLPGPHPTPTLTQSATTATCPWRSARQPSPPSPPPTMSLPRRGAPCWWPPTWRRGAHAAPAAPAGLALLAASALPAGCCHCCC